MDIIELIGFAAALCTTLSYVPQAIKTIKTKNTGDLSLVMYIILNMGIFCWLLYGFLIWSIPIIAANIITIMLTFTILMLKIKYK